MNDEPEGPRGPDTLADADQLAALRAGDAAVYEQVVREHLPRFLAITRRILGNEEDAREAVQDAFLSAFKGLPNFDGTAKLSTWLHRIAVNAVLARSRKRHEELGSDGSIEDHVATSIADTGTEDPGESRDLEHAIGRLPPGARHVLVLSGIYGYSHEETASMLGIAVGTCKAQLHRARQLLSTRLGLEEIRA